MFLTDGREGKSYVMFSTRPQLWQIKALVIAYSWVHNDDRKILNDIKATLPCRPHWIYHQ